MNAGEAGRGGMLGNSALWRENSSHDLRTELCIRVLELCSRSESWSWSSVQIECRSSKFYAN